MSESARIQQGVPRDHIPIPIKRSAELYCTLVTRLTTQNVTVRQMQSTEPLFRAKVAALGEIFVAGVA